LRTRSLSPSLALGLIALAATASAHPGSGIVVTLTGRVFFLETGNPDIKTSGNVWEIDEAGALKSLKRGGAHWLALDTEGNFASADFDGWFERRTVPWLKRLPVPGGDGGLIQADGMPLTVHGDGNLYYASRNLEITRLTPAGKTTLLVPDLDRLTDKLGGIKGLASGPDDTLCATCPGAVLRIKLDGTGSVLFQPVSLRDCGRQAAAELSGPGLRGLAVDDHGTVLAAATSCGRVVTVTPDGRVLPILGAESPWFPTGVAVHGSDLYVLEYSHANSDDRRQWRPRVRRLGPDGRVTTLATLGGSEPTGPPAAPRPVPGPLLAPAPGSPLPSPEGEALAAGDVNGDGCADLVLCIRMTLNVFFGSARGPWRAEPDVTTELPAKSSEIAVADLNHDGKQDLVLADHDGYAVTVLLGSGDGRFQAAPGSPFVAHDGTRPHTHGLAIADVNGDGHPDVVTANHNDGDVSLLLGDGQGRLVRAPRAPFPCGRSPYPIAATDINGDRYADVLVPNCARELKTLQLLLGNGRGELVPAPASPLTCDATVWFVAAGDLNGDRRPDVVATHAEGGTGATILINAGQGALSPAPGSPLELGHGAWGVEIADMNRDGNADLVFAGDEAIRLFVGDGRGGFQPADGSPYRTGKGAWRLVVADFDGDGKLDVATRCVEAKRIEIFSGH
jgi:hypothetical protein